MNELSRQAKSIFLSVLEIASPAEQAAIVAERCGTDSPLRREVEELLGHHEKLHDFLEPPPPEVAVTTIEAFPAEEPGTMIGPYKLLEQIGTGGMGVVYVAEQKEPVRRTVALKVIKPGMDTREVIARFEAERQALAMMNHPHIAKVLDAGSTVAGRPYFVMELVKGLPITDFCDGQQLDTRERLQLFITVCQAVQHAHQKGLIHRDLKPSNVLVEMHDVTPVLKVIDFGVAKAIGQQLTEKTLHTGFYQMLGTPMYMSPEQAGQSSLDVDTRSDVYSLGVLLYELLTGTTPFDKETFSKVGLDEMRRIIREEDPARPSQRVSTLAAANISTVSKNRGLEPSRLSSSLRGELDWIVMKALEKDRARRYESASELAQDVQRYLDGEAVRACPASAAYRFRKFARRNRIAFVTGALVAGALLLGTVVSTAQAIRATTAERLSEDRLEAEQKARLAADGAKTLAQENAAIAERSAAVAYRQQYKAEMHAGLGDWQAGNVNRLYQTLGAHLPDSGRADLRGWEWYYLLSRCLEGRVLCEHDAFISSMAWNPDGRYLATTSWDGTAIVWDARTGALIRRFGLGSTVKQGVAWSPDGKRLAWGSAADEGAFRIWDRITDKIHILHGQVGAVWCQWSQDGRRLATSGNPTRIWDTETWTCLYVVRGHHTCWARDGKFLVTVSGDVGGRVWDGETGALLREVRPESGLTSASMSSRGPEQLVLGTRSGSCWLVNGETWQIGQRIQAHAGDVQEVAFSPNGAMFASAGADGLVNVWDAADGRLLFRLCGHQGGVRALAWNPNAKELASGGHDNTVRVWDIPSAEQPTVVQGAPEAVRSLAWSEDDVQLTSVSDKDGSTTNWNRLEKAKIATSPTDDAVWRASSPNGHFEACAVAQEKRVVIRIHDVRLRAESGQLESVLEGTPRLVWSPDSNRLAAYTNRLQVWDVRAMQPVFSWEGVRINDLAWARDSSRLALAGAGDPLEDGNQGNMGYIHVFDVERQMRLSKLRMGSHWVHARCVAWNSTGTQVAGGHATGHVMVWNTEAQLPVVNIQMHNTSVAALDWTPDGRRIASSSVDGTLKIWDSASGDQLMSLTERGVPMTAVKWSSDGKKLATAEKSGRILVWDASRGFEPFSDSAQAREQSRIYGLRGKDAFVANEFDAAVLQLSRAIDLAPSRATYRRSRAKAYFRLDKIEESLADLNAAVDLDPENALALRIRADLLVSLGRPREALRDAWRVVELQQSGFSRFRLSVLYLMLGNFDAYRDVCRRMFEGEHDDVIAMGASYGAQACAIVPNSTSDINRVISLVRDYYARPVSAVDTPARNYSEGLLLGALLYRAGKMEEAIVLLSKASIPWEHGETIIGASDRLPAEAWYFLAMAHWRLGHYGEARTWFDKAEAYTKAAVARPAAIFGIESPGAIFWHQRVVLEHLQREARTLLNGPDAKAKPNEK